MDFFGSLINDVNSHIAALEQTELSPGAELWPELPGSSILMLRETACELKGPGFGLVTEAEFPDGILLCGKDLGEIKADAPFARICLISIEPRADEQELYELIRKTEYVKYSFFPEGYMLRSSSEAQREAVRVGKTALKKGLSFRDIGALWLSKLKAIPGVRSARLIFVTEAAAEIKALQAVSQKGEAITKALNRIVNSLKLDCDSCSLRPVCDEVEGMKELHFKHIK